MTTHRRREEGQERERVPVGMSDKSTGGEKQGTEGGCIEFGGGCDGEKWGRVKEHKLWKRCGD